MKQARTPPKPLPRPPRQTDAVQRNIEKTLNELRDIGEGFDDDVKAAMEEILNPLDEGTLLTELTNELARLVPDQDEENFANFSPDNIEAETDAQANAERDSKMSADYADFDKILQQHDAESGGDIKGDIEWELLTSDHRPAANANAAYQDLERMINPGDPPNQEPPRMAQKASMREVEQWFGQTPKPPGRSQ